MGHGLLHTFSGGSEYLRRGDGATSSKLLELVHDSLRITLSGALQRAERQGSDITFTGVELLRGNERQRGSVVVKPFTDEQGEKRFLISILVESAGETDAIESDGIDADRAVRERMVVLEQELNRTKENLQATIEELETSNEELQATNEELVASNEELQSTNEELHSVNEELYTVNAEHQHKIDELTALTEDMDNLLKASDSATLFLDDELCIRHTSPRAQDIFHILEADLGRRLDAFNHKLDYPDLIKDARAVLTEKQPREREIFDSEGTPYLVRLNPFESLVGSVGVVITMVDISLLTAAHTELAISEQRFRGTFVNAAVGIAHVNLDGSWLKVNQRLCEIVGYSREELLESNFQAITHRDDVTSDVQQLGLLICGEIDRYAMEKRYIGKDGKEIWIHLTVSLQRAPEGQPLYCISIVQYITKRKHFERDITQSMEQRDRFLATLSHELRNPLAALLHAAHLMEHQPEEAISSKALGVLLRQSSQMSHLLDDLLDISRITQNKITLSFEPCDLRLIANEAIEAILPQVELKSHELHIDLHDAEVWINGDRTRLVQVIENLLTNAVKYTNNGGEIHLEVAANEGRAEIAVRDTGQGLSERMLTEIFTMFVQSEESVHDREGGMGLGLTLVRSLVAMHDGTVRAASEGEGQGSTFTVSLPLTNRRPNTQESIPPNRQVKHEKRRRVVLVEDEPDAREMLAECLRMDGYEVIEAQDGDEGLAAMIKERPDVALVDIALPGLSGLEIAAGVRERRDTDNIYLVALTGYGRESDRKKALDAGFDEHLVKPVLPDDLERVLTRPAR